MRLAGASLKLRAELGDFFFKTRSVLLDKAQLAEYRFVLRPGSADVRRINRLFFHQLSAQLLLPRFENDAPLVQV